MAKEFFAKQSLIETINQKNNQQDSSLAAKQDLLVSGTNIKTINSQSLLGSGDIAITSSGGSANTVFDIIRPEDNGAKGDNTTLDDNAFQSNKTYYLTEGKTYYISVDKMDTLIKTCKFVGKGKLRCEPHRGWTRPNGYNNAYYEYPTEEPRNIIEQCHTWWAVNNSTDDTVNRKNYYMKGGTHMPANTSGYYANLAAVYINYSFEGTKPTSFTICVGRNTVWQRTTSTSKWDKTIDQATVRQVQNFKLPWADDNHRSFDNASSAKYVDGHFEMVINTNELTEWQGNDDVPASAEDEAVIHFWSSPYYFEADEFDHLMSSWEIWVKEPEAAGLLVMTTGIDIVWTGNTGSRQAYSDGGQLITTDKLVTWGSTLNFAQLRTLVDTDEILSRYNGDKYVDYSLTGGKNFNLFGLNNFNISGEFTNDSSETVTVTLNCTSDVLTITCDNPSNKTEPTVSFSLYQYLKNKNLKAGTYTLGYEFVEGTPGWFGYFRPNINNVNERFELKNLDTLGKTFYKTMTLTGDLSDFAFGVTPAMTGTKLRMWITEGETSREYQAYGADVSGYRLKDDIVVPDVEDIQDKLYITQSELESALMEVYSG